MSPLFQYIPAFGAKVEGVRRLSVAMLVMISLLRVTGRRINKHPKLAVQIRVRAARDLQPTPDAWPFITAGILQSSINNTIDTYWIAQQCPKRPFLGYPFAEIKVP